MNRFLLKSTISLIVLGFVALGVIIAMTFWLNVRAQNYFDAVIEARDTRAATVELRNAILSAESSQRGFLYTNNEIYLSPYETAKAQATRHREVLDRALGGYPELSAARKRLGEALSEKIAEMDRTIALKRERREDDLAQLVRTNRGKALMDEANVYFAGIIRAAEQRLTVAIDEQRSNASLLRLVSLLSAGVITLVVGVVAFTVTRNMRDIARGRDELTRMNEGLEQRVQERTSELTRTNEELQRFAYIVTHDLRAPLVNIMGFTSELETGIGSLQALIDQSAHLQDAADPIVREARAAAKEDLPEAIRFIRSSTRKMDNLINAILKLAREGRRQLKWERINIEDAVNANVQTVQHQISAQGGEISLDISAPIVRADRLSFEQVLGNVLDNAVKYRSNDRPLKINLRSYPLARGNVQIDIEDNGRGIAEEDLERVFDLFRRAGSQDLPGEGIGLAYVRTLVRNLGGDVKLASKLDQGTTISIVLPAG